MMASGLLAIAACKPDSQHASVSASTDSGTSSFTSTAGSSAAEPDSDSSSGTGSACVPEFPFKDGWLGGDAIFSVRLDETSARTLWMFGDTFINKNDPTKRGGGKIVANSIAISTCIEGRFSIRYHWGQGWFGVGEPEPFFKGESDDTWPGGAVIVGDKLHVFGIHVKKDPSLPGGFATLGTRLITVDNFADAPESWSYRTKELGTGKDLLAGVSVLEQDDFLLLYSSMTSEKAQPMTLLRCPRAKVEDCAPELLTEAGWEKFEEGRLKDAKRLLDGASTEFSVERIGERYLLVNNSIKNGFPADGITVSYAAAPDAVFSDPVKVQAFPGNADFGTKQAYCYAAKEHVHLREDDSVLVTYICNSFDFLAETVPNRELYKVIAARIKLPPQQ